MKDKPTLTPKQAKFCTEYLKDLNATQAALRSGYSPKGANVTASQLLANPNIQAVIAKGSQKATEKAEITTEFILGGLKQVALRCMQAEPVLDREGNPIGEYQFRDSGANRAFELLGKYKGLFADKLNVEHSGEVKMSVNVVKFGGKNAKQ